MVAKYLEELRRAVIQSYKFVDNISSIKDFVGILIFIGIAVVWLLGVDKRTIKKCSMIQTILGGCAIIAFALLVSVGAVTAINDIAALIKAVKTSA